MDKKTIKNLSSLSIADRKRRKREVVIILAIVTIVAILTFAENRIIHFGADFPISNTILMFILININMLLLLLLIFLVLRNLVKLLYDRKRKVMGARLRTKLVIAFIALTLIPAIVLFFFSINFITTSIEFWFNVPVEQALENSLSVGRKIYTITEDSNRFFLDRVAYQIKTKKLYEPAKHKALSHYVQVVQNAFNIDGVEVYGANSKRLTYALLPKLENKPFSVVSANDLQKEMDANNVRTITEMTDHGQLIRTIATVPFGVKHTEANAFVVLNVIIPPDLSEKMSSISRGFEEYQQIKLLKRPIKITYYITLSIVGLLVVFCAVWFGFYLAKSITIPIMALAEGTKKVAEGDLSFSIGAVADDEIGSLVNSFNKMTKDLRGSREQLELSARMLRERNIEIEARRQYMEIVLKNVSTGVITLDARGYITTINTSAEKMLSLKSEDVLKESYRSLLWGQHLNMARDVMERLMNAEENAVELPLKLIIKGRPRSFLVNLNALKGDAGEHMGIVMVFDDLTELEKAQRMAAWREVARRIAHEVKNPLTPITLSAQRLKRKYSKDLNEPIFDECTQTIIDHVDLIQNLVNEFSSFARFPTADPKPCDILPIIEETVALYREGHQNIRFSIQAPSEVPTLNLDRQQLKQAMINLVDNAISALKEAGDIAITLIHDKDANKVRVEVADNGQGISDEDKSRLFEPNFSTKKTGMGLGLTIVSTIVNDHNGVIRVRDNDPHGAIFSIELPV
ncbi:MAG: PAS domain-containing protein [Deltaproteobacteria bacterium]|nr:PAS domain-containing protein [Deltaproteobacteria bacterium]